MSDDIDALFSFLENVDNRECLSFDYIDYDFDAIMQFTNQNHIDSEGPYNTISEEEVVIVTRLTCIFEE